MKGKNSLNIILCMFLLIISISFISSAAAGFGEIDIQSNYKDLDCPDGCWVFRWTDDGYTTDGITASWDSDDIEADGAETTQDLDINLEGTDNFCEWNINRETERLDIFTVDIIEEKTYYPSWKYSDDEELEEEFITPKFEEMGCLQIDDYANDMPGYYDAGFLYVDTVCYKKRDTLGKIGSLQDESIKTQTEFEINPEGESPQSKVVSNDESGEGKSTKIGDDVYIQWEGLLSSGESCPTTENMFMAYDPGFGDEWKTIDRNNYISNYESYMTSDLSSLARDYYEGGYSKEEAESIVNDKSSEAISERDFDDFNIDVENIEDWEDGDTDGTLDVELENQIAYPQFRLIIDSDYLNLDIPTGKPKVTSSSYLFNRESFRKGEVGEFDVTAENVGNAEGGFNFRVKSCTEGFSAGDTTDERLEAGESEEITLTTTSEVGENEVSEGSCEIEMTESSTGETDTTTVYLKAEEMAECEREGTWCSYSDGQPVVKKCVDGEEVVTETCEYTCDIDDEGEAFCKTEDISGTCQSNDDCAWYENCVTEAEYDKNWYHYIGIGEPDVVKTNQCKTKTWVYVVMISFFIFLSIIAVTFVNNLMKKNNKSTRRKR